ncbi:MAG: DUF11 domain-containing protein, partial [Chloroflexi bacterium]|nr:DUF11 domain-containing protein [Chloroflexota bacterium]
LAWNIQPGADTWSGREYKGYIYAADIIRGFDVYRATISADPIVAIQKSGPRTSRPGDTLTYRISYQNVGPAASRHARISDELPAGLSFVAASDGGSYDPATGMVVWSLGSVPAATADEVTLRVRVRASVPDGTLLTNRARFTGDLTVSPPAGVHVLLVGSGVGVRQVSIL